VGLDFIKCRVPTFKKSWNHNKLELATPSLFTRLPGARTRSVTAHCSAVDQMSRGSPVTLVSTENQLLVLKGTRCVGKVDSVPAETLEQINDAGGVAWGTVGEIHALSETIDVELI
jgi:hypothetical protein